MRKPKKFNGDCICLDVNAVFSILRKILYFNLKKRKLFMVNYTCWLYAVYSTVLHIYGKFFNDYLTVHGEILTSEGSINPSDGLFYLFVDLQEEK